MDLKNVLASLGIPEAEDVFAPAWEESEGAYPYPCPPFLDPALILEWCQRCGLDPALDSPLLAAAEKIRNQAALAHLLWHAHRLLFRRPEYNGFKQWPSLERALGEHEGVFHLLNVLGGMPRMAAFHAAKGIPPNLSAAVASDIAIGVTRFGRLHPGHVGLQRQALAWYRNHIGGALYRLGRFNFIAEPFRYNIRAFRHRRTNEVLALSYPGARFDGAGFVDGIGGIFDQAHGWTSRLECDGVHLVGNPVLPTGVAVNRLVKLPLHAWQEVVRRDDDYLAIHIPEGGGMRLDECRESIEEAMRFFPRYFPERQVKGLMCGSWILNPEIEQFYSPDSNIVRLQRETYLFPRSSSGRDGIRFIFDCEDQADLKAAPRDTSLRRAILDHLERGGILRTGGMFLLKDDLPRFGQQPYRTQKWVQAVANDDVDTLRQSDILSVS
jgi:hypothetical protein